MAYPGKVLGLCSGDCAEVAEVGLVAHQGAAGARFSVTSRLAATRAAICTLNHSFRGTVSRDGRGVCFYASFRKLWRNAIASDEKKKFEFIKGPVSQEHRKVSALNNNHVISISRVYSKLLCLYSQRS